MTRRSRTCLRPLLLLLGCWRIALGAAVPGATVPFTTYEAEDMTISGGTIVGPPAQVANKNAQPQSSVERESSGQRCVKLTAAGQSVQFTAQGAANAIVVRYSVPDSSDGAGLDSTITVTVNGGQAHDLAITSRYAWRYGDYPYTNSPSSVGANPWTGPRNYYDEVRFLGLAINANDTVRIAKTANDAAAYCIIDLVDLENVPAALGAPANALSVRDAPYNAAGNGATNDTAAIQTCIGDAISQGKAVFIPTGTYLVSGEIAGLHDVTIQGAGMWYSTLVGDPAVYNTDASRQIRFTGANGANNIAISDLAIIGRLNHRNDGDANDGFQGEYGTGSSIRRVWIEHTKTGVWPRNASGFVVDSCRIRNTIADGINFTIGMRSSTMSNCTVRGAGDDCFAIWPEPASDVGRPQLFAPGLNVISFCTGSVNSLANGAAIYGAESNAVQDCLFHDIPDGAGVMVGKSFPGAAFSGTTTVQRCTLIRAGGFDTAEWHGALTLDPESSATGGLALAIDTLTISSSLGNGVMLMGGKPMRGTIANVGITASGLISPPSSLAQANDGSFGVWARSDATGGLTVSGLTVNGTAVTSVPAQPSDLLRNSSGAFTFTFAGGAAPGVTSGQTASGTVGQAFAYQITGSHGPTGFNASGLPAGLSVNTTTGVISGTPTAAATTSVTISATNASGTGSATLVITVAAATTAPVITSALTASGTVGQAFSYQIAGSATPTGFNASGLPSGLSVDATTGAISGTPLAAGTTSVTITATNGAGSGNATLTITITAPAGAGGGGAGGGTPTSGGSPSGCGAGSAFAVLVLALGLMVPGRSRRAR